jgi:hypothetical protein
MGGQKELQGTPSDHAAVGLEPCLLFEPIEIVIEPCHEGQRQPYIDNGRRLPWRAADTALWRRCCVDWGQLVGLHCHHPALRWGHTVLLLSEGAYIPLYHINYYCGIKYSQEFSLHLTLVQDFLHAPQIFLFDLLIRYPGIALAGGNRGMPQKFLDRDDLGALLE